MPPALTEIFTVEPTAALTEAGWVVIVGFSMTVRVAGSEDTVPVLLLIWQRYW